MARILFTGTSTRAVANWLPAFQRLQGYGHRVESLLFPHTTDPDHQGLYSLAFPRMAVLPIPESLRRISPHTVTHLATQACAEIRRDPPDCVVLTTCHAGPEAHLARMLSGPRPQPVLFGCQHGYVQNWPVYWNKFSYDHFIVFGEAFRAAAPEHLRHRIHAPGLPKLDAIVARSRPPFTDDFRPILFAAQTTCNSGILQMLHALRVTSSREVIVRPHPEFPDLFASAGVNDGGRDEPLSSQIDRCSLVVTSGSTTAIESLVAGCPCVVLPLERGDEYHTAGIVTSSTSPEEILSTATRQQTAEGRELVAVFLAATVGAGDRRAAERTADLLVSRLPQRGLNDKHRNASTIGASRLG